jgi:hypothetical protein
MNRRRFARLALACAFSAGTIACAGTKDEGPVVATPSVTLPPQAPAGQSTDVTYRFAVASDAPAFAEDFTVFVHAFNEQGGRVWTSDHEPPTPTREWKPGSVIEYTRPMAIPRDVRGPVTIQLGLYSPRTQERMTLAGDSDGDRAYRVGAFEITATATGPSAVYANGFYPLEAPEHAQGVEWRWSQRSATVWVPNPKQDADFVLELDQPATAAFAEPQRVEIRSGKAVIDAFPLPAGQRTVRRVPIAAADAGTAAMVRLTIAVDRTFVPSKLPQGATGDNRELGLRVFHARLEPRTP